jgi:hypothetical protein
MVESCYSSQNIKQVWDVELCIDGHPHTKAIEVSIPNTEEAHQFECVSTAKQAGGGPAMGIGLDSAFPLSAHPNPSQSTYTVHFLYSRSRELHQPHLSHCEVCGPKSREGPTFPTYPALYSLIACSTVRVSSFSTKPLYSLNTHTVRSTASPLVTPAGTRSRCLGHDNLRVVQ